jgi:hypothetical protein
VLKKWLQTRQKKKKEKGKKERNKKSEEYSARKMKLVTSLKFHFVPASPSAKLLHNQQTKWSSKF